MKTSTDRLIQQLRSTGRFVFAFKLNDLQLSQSEESQKATMRVNFEKALTAFFENRPSVINNSNEVERF